MIRQRPQTLARHLPATAAPLLLLTAALLAACSVRGSGPAAGAAVAAPPSPAATAAAATGIDTRAGRDAFLTALEAALHDNYMALASDPVLNRLWERKEQLLETTASETFYATINELLGRSNNDHLYLYRPGRNLFDEAISGHLLVGAATAEIHGYQFISDIWEGGPAAEAGLLFGDEILPIDGKFPQLDPWPEDTDQQVVWIRRDRETPPFFVTLEPVAGDTLWYMSEASRASIRRFDHEGCRVGSLHLRSFADADLVQDLITGAHFDDIDGLVLDLRGNRGGEIRLAAEVFDLLSRRPSVWIQYRQRHYTFPPTHWDRPLVVLVNAETRSAAEIFAAAVQVLRLGTVVGMPTAGQVQASRLFPLPDGSQVMIPVSTVALPDGTVLEGRGIIPDVPADRPIMYAAGADPQMARALEILAQLVACAEDLPDEAFPQERLAPGVEDAPAPTGMP